MKIECSVEKLKEVVSKVEKISQKNPTLPILSCILLEVKKNILIIKATNLDLGIEISIPVKTHTEGFVAVSASVLSQFLTSIISEKSVDIYDDGNVLHLETVKSKTSLKIFPVDDFPIIPRVEEGKEFDIDINKFVDGLKSVWYSSAISSIKPELSSVYIYGGENELIFVATDSFRLAEKKVKYKNTPDIPSILIPNKNVGEIIKIFDGEKENITLTINKNQVIFTSPSIYFTSRAVEGNFPDYKQIIPKEHTTTVTILKSDLMNALKVTNVFVDSFNQVRFSIEKNKKNIELTAKNGDVGENLVSITASVDGENLSVGFNYRYIIDCFQSIGSDSLILEFGGANKPLVIKGVSDQSFVYLVMPMNR